jgi:hypothetical protein
MCRSGPNHESQLTYNITTWKLWSSSSMKRTQMSPGGGSSDWELSGGSPHNMSSSKGSRAAKHFHHRHQV